MGLLRLLLAASVVLGHNGPILGTSLVPGPAAVEAFFAISGFYMALVLDRKYAADARGYRAFIGNRILRLYPTYLIVFAISVVAYATLADRAGMVTPWARLNGLDWPAHVWVWFVNLFVIGQDSLLFMAVDRPGHRLFFAGAFENQPEGALHFLVVPQAWTLSLEFVFYLLAPFVVRRRARVLAALIVASLALRLGLAVGLNWRADPFYNRFFPNELALFLLGALMYQAYRFATSRGWPIERFGWPLLAVIGVLSLTLTRLPIPFKALSFAAFVGAATPFLFAATKSLRWDRVIGELSFPLYIGHHLVGFTLGAFGVHGGVTSVGAISLGLSLILAVVIALGIERPVEHIRQRISERELRRRGRGGDAELTGPLAAIEQPQPAGHP